MRTSMGRKFRITIFCIWIEREGEERRGWKWLWSERDDALLNEALKAKCSD